MEDLKKQEGPESAGDEENNPEIQEEQDLPKDPGHDIREFEPQSPQRPFRPEVSAISAGIIGLLSVLFLYHFLGLMLLYAVQSINPDNTSANVIRLMTAAMQILFILLPAVVFAKMFYPDPGYVLRVKKASLPEIGLFISGLLVLFPLIQSFIGIQNYFIDIIARQYQSVREIKFFFDSADKVIQETFGDLMAAHNIFEGILVIVVTSLIPALCEEVMFRGYIQKNFEMKMKPFRAALITALFFGLFHFNPYGTIALISLGLYFGYAAYKSGSIIIPVTLHFLFNFISVILYFLMGSDEIIKSQSGDEFNLSYAAAIFFLFLVIFNFVLFLIRRFYKVNNA